MPFRRRVLVIEVCVSMSLCLYEKGFQYECLISLEKYGDDKRYQCVVGYGVCNMYG